MAEPLQRPGPDIDEATFRGNDYSGPESSRKNGSGDATTTETEIRTQAPTGRSRAQSASIRKQSVILEGHEKPCSTGRERAIFRV